MKNLVQYIPSLASFLIGGGLQISGIVVPWLGYSLIGLGLLLLLIPIRSYKRRRREQALGLSGKVGRPTTGIVAENSIVNIPRARILNQDIGIKSKDSTINAPDAAIVDKRRMGDR